VHILIVKLGSIGDIVHTLPAAAAIRRHLPSAEISWVVEKRAAEILRGNPVIDRLIEIDTKGLRAKGGVDDMLRELRDQVGELRKSRFDLAIDFAHNYRSARALLTRSGGSEIWSRSRLPVRRMQGAVVVSLLVPARLLQPGDYTITLMTDPATSSDEVIADYIFRISPTPRTR